MTGMRHADIKRMRWGDIMIAEEQCGVDFTQKKIGEVNCLSISEQAYLICSTPTEPGDYMVEAYGTSDISTMDFSKLSGKGVYMMRASYPKNGAWRHASLYHGTDTYGKNYGTNPQVYRLYLWKYN